MTKRQGLLIRDRGRRARKAFLGLVAAATILGIATITGAWLDSSPTDLVGLVGAALFFVVGMGVHSGEPWSRRLAIRLSIGVVIAGPAFAVGTFADWLNGETLGVSRAVYAFGVLPVLTVLGGVVAWELSGDDARHYFGALEDVAARDEESR